MEEGKEITAKNSVYTDYKAEFLASCLIENGLDEEGVRIVRQGLAQPGKAVDKVCWEYSANKFVEHLTIYARKRDLYESLPEGVFHKRLDIEEKKSQQAVIESFKKNRQVALSAKFFFKPFEMSIDRMLVMAHLFDLQIDKRDKHATFINLIRPYWEVICHLPLDKALLVISFFSQAYRLNQPHQVAEVISEYLDCEVQIESLYKTMTLGTYSRWKLGATKLGLDSVIGDSLTDCYPVVSIAIKGLSQKYKDLLDKKSQAYLQFIQLLELFVPADAETEIHITMAKENQRFVLSSDTVNSSILGLTTILS